MRGGGRGIVDWGAGRRIDNQRRRLKRCITISERV